MSRGCCGFRKGEHPAGWTCPRSPCLLLQLPADPGIRYPAWLGLGACGPGALVPGAQCSVPQLHFLHVILNAVSLQGRPGGRGNLGRTSQRQGWETVCSLLAPRKRHGAVTRLTGSGTSYSISRESASLRMIPTLLYNFTPIQGFCVALACFSRAGIKGTHHYCMALVEVFLEVKMSSGFTTMVILVALQFTLMVILDKCPGLHQVPAWAAKGCGRPWLEGSKAPRPVILRGWRGARKEAQWI